MKKSLYLVAGEVSGDRYGASLMNAIRHQDSAICFGGLGGEEMAQICPNMRSWVSQSAVIGIPSLAKIDWYKTQLAQFLQQLENELPQVIILIDFGSFNLQLAKQIKLRKLPIQVINYISPKFWAWNYRRIYRMAKFFDQVLCIFPFEVESLQRVGLKADFVGNPLVEELNKDQLKIERDSNLIALLPGSRLSEIGLLLPILLEVASQLAQSHKSLKFEIPVVDEESKFRVENEVKKFGLETSIKVTVGQGHQLMQKAHCGVIASGTATLEAAFYGLPHCLIYKLAGFDFIVRLVAKYVLKTKYVGLPNIVADRELIKEFLDIPLRIESIVKHVSNWVNFPDSAHKLTDELQVIKKSLSVENPYQKVAELICLSLNKSV